MTLPSPAVELDSFNNTGEVFYQQVVQKIRATTEGKREAPEVYLERLRNYVLSDRVAFFFNIGTRMEGENLRLIGEVERLEFKTIVRETFKRLGFTNITDEVTVIPDLKQTTALYGVVIAPYVLTSSQPGKMAVPMDEALFGEPVYILRELPATFLVKSLTGYWGYTPKESIRPIDRLEFVKFLNHEAVIINQYFKADEFTIPAGSRLTIQNWGNGQDCLLLSPLGKTLQVPKAICRKNDRRKELEPVIDFARSFLKAPYNRGGKNQQSGIDCSGLIQLSYRTIGLNLPRDAKQQYLGGNFIPPYLTEALLPGDALFFMNGTGQVNHVALYLGNGKIIHATGDQVKINSLDPAAKDYLARFARDYIGAKRFWW